MFSKLFGQLFNSFGIVFRIFRAFFMRQIVSIGARVRRVTSFSRQAARALPKAMSAAAVAGKKPTKREDYIETKRLFVAKSLIVIIILVLIILLLLGYFIVWPWLRSAFFTAHFWRQDKSVPAYSGKVVLYYDEPKDEPLFQGNLKDGVIQGQGMSFDEEGLTLYAGGYADGEYHGLGKLYEHGALIYDGQFEKGVYHGSGKLYADNLLLYEGQFDRGFFHGTGQMYDGGRLLYDGQFQSGAFEGAGRLYESGGLLYEGQFSGGAYHGQGTLFDGDKIKYAGEFAAGAYDGLGTEYDRGELRYKGGFAGGAYDGEGSLFGADGAALYRGGFSEGLKNGYGIEYYPSGNMRYQGGFAAGAYDGEGRAYKSGGALEYAGGYREGLYQNAGTLHLDEEYTIEAEFDAGSPKGGIRVFRGGRLYYEGASDGVTPHGQGTLYASTGEAVYKGKMFNGKIDAGALLGVSADAARAAFADAELSEFRGVMAGFTINNPKLGVTLFCTLKTDTADSAVIYVYLYTETADAFFDFMPWETAADYEAWRGSSGLPEPWRVTSGYLTPDFTGGVPFPKERYHRVTYNYGDHVFCAWSREEGGALLIAEWITAGDLSGLNASAGEGNGSPSTMRTEALLNRLGLADGGGGAPAEPSAYYGGGDAALLFQNEKADYTETAGQVAGHALNYLENAEKREIYDELIGILNGEIAELRDAEAMGSAGFDPARAEALEDEAAGLELQRSRCVINMEKEQLAVEALAKLRLSDYDLQDMLFVKDPSEIEPETTDEKLALMDLELTYQELLQAQSGYERALSALNDASAEFAMMNAAEAQLNAARKAECNARLRVYTLLCGYTREMLAYNALTNGALSSKYDWFPDIFGADKTNGGEPPSVTGG